MKSLLVLISTIIISIFFSNHSYAQGGDNAAAAAAAPITLPFSSAGTTCGHVDNYNPLSPYGIIASGNDWLYYFCAPSNGQIDVFLNNAFDYMPAIMVYSATPNAGGTNWFATSFTGATYINSLVSFTATAGTCYYVMIDNDFEDDGFGCFPYNINIQYHTNPPASVLQPGCTNMGYDLGNLSGWIGTTGVTNIGAAGAPTPVYTPLYYTTSATQHSVTSGAGVDPYGGFPIVNPTGGSNSLRLGDMGTFGTSNQYFGGVPGATGATLEQKFQVTAANALFVYYYAVVLQDAGTDHTNQEQPFFKTDVFDCAGNPVACGQYLVTGGPGIPGFTLASGTTNVYYKNWSPVAVDLTPFIGSCVTVRYTVGDCTRGAHFAYAYIDAVCSPLAITGINQVCPNKTTTLTAPAGLFTYSWTPGGQTTQSITVTPTTTTQYSVELTSYTNCKTGLTYTVSLYPQATASINSSTVCNGTSATLTSTLNNGAGSYSWSPSGGTGANANVTPGSTTVYTLTYTDSNGCQDTALGRVTVNPLPTMIAPSNTTVCHNSSIPASAFTSTVSGTTYAWTNSNTTIGLVANGTGNTPAFTAINTSASPVTAVISVTPTANTCVGTPITYSIVVNPIPNVNAVSSSTYCSGVSVPTTVFNGSVSATTYSWTNSNTAIGLGASGTGNVNGFTSSNNTANQITGVVTVTPTANTCVGTPTSFSVLVNPIPNVNAVASSSYCSGANVPASTFSGTVTGTSFNWSNTNTTIGLGGVGSGNTPAFVAVNNTSAPVTGVVTVTPSANTCTGTPVSYSISVNPIPNANAISNATYCSGAAVPASAFTGSVAGTTFNWVNSNTVIGLSANGVGNTPAFTANNTGSIAINGVITVTPTANTCTGTPVSYSIIVNPIPSVSVPTNSAYCGGATVPVSTFTSNVGGTTFNWSNTDSSIGLGASGTGNAPSFVAVNNGAAQVTGIISVTPSANSCVGTPVNFNITVNPTPVAPTANGATVCANASATLTATAPGGTYNWYDAPSGGTLVSSNSTYVIASLASTTNYYVNSTNGFGCVGPMTMVPATVLNVLPVTAVPNQTVCAGISATLGVNPNGTGYVYSWDEPGNAAFSAIYNPVVTPAVTTIYTVTVTSPNGCIGTGQTQVFVMALPLANAGNPITFCNGQSGSLGSGAIPGYNYSWSPISGLSNSLVSNPTVTLTNFGTTASVSVYTLTVTSNGCQSSNTVQVTVNPNPISEGGNNLTLCAAQNGTIGTNPTGGYNYLWTPGTNLSNPLNANPTVTGVNNGGTPIATGYTVTTTDGITGCQSMDQVTVTVLPLPTVNAGSAPTTCQGSGAVPLNGLAGGSVNSIFWSGGSGGFSPNNGVLNPTYNPTAAEYLSGSVTLTLTVNATAPCQNVNSVVTVSFYPNPVVNFTVDDPNGCPEHCVQFTDNSIIQNPENIQNWSWAFGDGGSSTLQNPGHCYSQPGMYSVTLTVSSNHGCSASMMVPQMIEVYPKPDASFIANPPSVGVLDPTIDFINTSTGATTYYWDFGDMFALDGSNTSALVNPSHTYSHSGDYDVNLIVYSSHGCYDRATLTVKVEPEFTFYIANAFTPRNSDGINDVFTGKGIGIEKYEMWVFDRWGEQIYYTNDIYKGWDGMVKGKDTEAKQDVYVWKVKIKDVLGRYHDYVGHVTLLP